MTASSLSNRGAHLVADVVREADRITEFLGDIDERAFLANTEKAYAVQKALQNTCEACIQRDGKKGRDRFEELFPNHSMRDVKTVGDRLRHDYGGADVQALRNDVHDFVPPLRADAEAILAALRRLHGRPDAPVG